MKIEDKIDAHEIIIGKNCYIGERVKITGRFGKKAERIIIGDNCRIDDDCRIFVSELITGDYLTLNNHCLINGDAPIHIGHSVWIGQNVILDPTAPISIGNGVGIGAYSQLWTHIRHGDILQGCRWDSKGELVIGDDAWFVGHVIVSPTTVEPMSMAMVGAVITHPMRQNRVYGGSPAVDITEKVGPQFEEVSDKQKMKHAHDLLNQFHTENPEHRKGAIRLVESKSDFQESDASWFAILDRLYTKKLTKVEVDFIKFAYPVKFFPLL